MKKILIILFLFFAPNLRAEEYQLFHTSICYDLLSSIQYYETLFNEDEFGSKLKEYDNLPTLLESINDKVKASHLCNLYSILPTDKDNIDSCITFIEKYTPEILPEAERSGKYLENILSVKSEIVYVLQILKDAGYQQYWQEKILPAIQEQIDVYNVDYELLRKINNEIVILAGDTPLSEDFSKIYILNISNAFSLIDETFCCTYKLLDKELANQYRINFIQVYIHENLHRLHISKELMKRLEQLYEKDEFYRENETVARGYNEGYNEAFVVAAECYVSQKLGLKSRSDVINEFRDYVDGKLVLAPIVFVSMSMRHAEESFNNFLTRLFDEKIIEPGKIEEAYLSAMEDLSV